MQVPASAAKAVVVGPTAISAYSEFSGAKLFVVTAVTGTDSDCQAAAQTSTASPLPGDKMQTLSVGAGQLACVVASSDRNIELLWKAQKDSVPAPMMLARR